MRGTVGSMGWGRLNNMINLPKFLLYGQDDPKIESSIQPSLDLRSWGSLISHEKEIAFKELRNRGWYDENYSSEILITIQHLNHHFLRQCPGQHLHAVQPTQDYRGHSNEFDRMKAAALDFQHIFLYEKSDSMVFRMLSKFAESYIDRNAYRRASEVVSEEERAKNIGDAFDDFDKLSSCLNHIFEQFSVNQMLTRNGFIPRQEKKIVDQIYTPTLKILTDPKWKTVSDNLAGMFNDYREKNYPEAITKAHSSVQRFLQILVGEEGKNGMGELGKLFGKAKTEGIIPVNRFTEPIVTVLQGFIPSERATNSTAKPSLKETTASDAILMMNIVMVFLQHCLQNTTKTK